jgi:GTP cyclohydrolase I
MTRLIKANKPLLQDHVKEIIKLIGEDPQRAGLKQTPERVEKMLKYLTKGYKENIDKLINSAIFESDIDEMILVKDIDFFSLCEHHLLPFFGRCHIAYLPDKKIIGLSKFVRLVEAFSRRLQTQETLTMQIARAIQGKLRPLGVGVVMHAYHLCMIIRGVEKQNALCVTSAMLGRFKADPRTRHEFLELIGLKYERT